MGAQSTQGVAHVLIPYVSDATGKKTEAGEGYAGRVRISISDR